MLFTLTIDPNAEEDVATLQRWAFDPGNTWVYKPISYLAAFDSQLVAANVEHSVVEAGTLATAVTRMRQLDLDSNESQYDEHIDTAIELIWQSVVYAMTE